MTSKHCYHCGDLCEDDSSIDYDDKIFCCTGCKTVYEIFSENNLTNYYSFQDNPGAAPKDINGKYNFLDSKDIITRLLDFEDASTAIVTFYIPHIHCSSCIWVLENLQKLNPAIISSLVDFPKKKVRITYNPEVTTLKAIVLLLSAIGYEPYISLEDYNKKDHTTDRSLIYKLGIAGFAFGNVMFLSFPEYFQVDGFWLEKYKFVFRWLMFIFSLPVVFYAGSDYFISAYKGLKAKILNIDVPIALGIFVLFVRSSIEVFLNLGTGFFDSLTGLVFFLLLGKFFQQKTYSFLSFERDYKSYFPIAVTKIKDTIEESVTIYNLKKGDRILIRNEELIPADGILIKGNANIDYSFVTGEAAPVSKQSGDKLFAGGKQISGSIEVEILKTVSQSYLTQLWSNAVFTESPNSTFTSITNRISKNFTIWVLSVAFLSTAYWLFADSTKALNVFTSVLIIACPCAIALAAPFTFGNMLRIFGKQKFYLKNATVIEQLAKVNTLVFDKTGTLTSTKDTEISYKGTVLTLDEKMVLKSILRNSNHPLSRFLYQHIKVNGLVALQNYKEIVGKGITAATKDVTVVLGAPSFVGYTNGKDIKGTTVHVRINGTYKGCFVFKNAYRSGLQALFNRLQNTFKLAVVSGDNDGELQALQSLLPKQTTFLFNQKPEDKLNVVAKEQQQNTTVCMIGDGLNDAGALAKSDVGIAISENINVFSPACDAILDASQFKNIAQFLKVSKQSVSIVNYCFIVSLCYNVVGLYFAVTGQLMPVIAAILMPLSSISVVALTTISTTILGKKLHQ